MGTYVPNVATPPFEWGENEILGTGGDETKSLVLSEASNAATTAKEMLDRLVGADGESGFLGDLENIIESLPSPEITALTVTSPALGVTTDTRPVVDIESIDTDFPEFTASLSSLTTLPTIDLSSISPADIPEEITAAINWFEESHDITLFTDLLTRLQTDLQSGATGLDADVEQSIYDRTLARQAIEDARVQSEIEDYHSARGFPLPTGAYEARIAEQANEISRNNTDLNSKIYEEQVRLAQSNSQFIITASKDLEAVLRDFTNRKNDRNLDYQKAVAANAISIYAESIKAYIAAAEANKIYVEVQVENLKAIVAYNDGLISQFSTQAQAYGNVVDAKAKKNKAITDIYDSEIKGFEAETEAISANQTILLEKYKAEISENDMQLKAAIANADTVLRSYIAESSLKEKVSADMANIAMQSVASAYGQVNMSASLSHSTGVSRGETFSHGETRGMSYSKSESLAEKHSFTEEA